MTKLADPLATDRQLYITVRGKRHRRCMPVWGSCRLKENHKGMHDAYARGGRRSKR